MEIGIIGNRETGRMAMNHLIAAHAQGFASTTVQTMVEKPMLSEMPIKYHMRPECDLSMPVEFVDYPQHKQRSSMNQRKYRKLARQNPHSKYNK